MGSPHLQDIVKAYDVRGLVPDQLDDAVATALGSAFAQVVVLPEAPAGAIPAMVVGHDMRASSPGLSAAFGAGVSAHGVDVTMIGLCSTDGLYYASGSLGLPGAMFTASHNPAAYNGIKLCRDGARPVSADSGLEQVRDLGQSLLDRGGMHQLPPATPTGRITHRDLLASYADHLLSLVDLRGGRRLRVVIDAGNGMAGLTAPAVLDRPELPLDIVPLYFELDGTFPHHEANPLEPENLRDLQAAVVRHRADLGLAFDGDADRCFVIDEHGDPVSPSAVTALIAGREIDREAAAGVPREEIAVVHNLICSASVPQTIAAHGARPVRTRVGHSYVKAVMAEHRAVFGGEHSGHYYFREFWNADTGMLAALHVLAALAGSDAPLSQLADPFHRYAASGEINSTVTDVAAATARVRTWGEREGCTVDLLDGLTLVHPDRPWWWVSLRPSNTEALLRLNVESDRHDTMGQVRDHVLAMVREQ